MLTACEWFDVFVDQQRQVRLADPKVGVWYLAVDQSGDYEIELRRYPRESELAIGQGIPATNVTDGQYAAGQELPVAKARLRIGSFDKTIDVGNDATSATFTIGLTAGSTEMQTCFLDADGTEICGAYYVYIRRTSSE